MTARDGAFTWYELLTPDAEGARAFYAAVTGWTIADSGMPGMRYLLARVGERPLAGLMGILPEMEGVRPAWRGYIHAADVDAMAARATAAGGTIHRAPSDIPGVGRFAVVSDPQGAAFMLFRPDGPAMPDLPFGTPGDVGWRELHCRDWPAAFAFYAELFGWEKAQAVDMGPMGTYQTFTIGETWAGGMMNDAEAPSPYWLYYITVADIDAAAGRIAAAGGRVVNGPHPVPGGSFIVHATDPQGVFFALTGPRV